MTNASYRRIERLTKALEVMSQPVADLPIEVFDMGDWGTKNGGRHGCQTAACGAGTMSLHPWFRRRGFRGVWSQWDELRLAGDATWSEQVSTFFGLSIQEAYSLTVATCSVLDRKQYDGITSKRQFCARLRRLLKHYTATDVPLHGDA